MMLMDRSDRFAASPLDSTLPLQYKRMDSTKRGRWVKIGRLRFALVMAVCVAALLLLLVYRDAGPQIVTQAEIQAVQDAQYAEIDSYLDAQVAEADRLRAESFQPDLSSIQAYERSIEPRRQQFFELLGGNPYEPAPLKPREELILDRGSHKAYRVWINAFDRVTVYGILLAPKGPGPFPALVCVHGTGGTPEVVCGLTRQDDYHHRFAERAVERGYLVFAPMDVAKHEWRSRLDRKAIMVGQRLQALEQFKLLRVVDYLAGRKDVLPERIGAYGISWGGRAVMNLAALDRRVAACVISGHFNDRLPKMLVSSPHYKAFIETPVHYAFHTNHARLFSDADVVLLICPRPVFIEQGRRDRNAYWKMSQRAFGPVREIYERLALADRAVYSLFEGAHEVRGVESFQFLDRWLKPAR